MSTTMTRFGIEIDAPDGSAALDLERRLEHLASVTVGRGAHWFVEVAGPADPEAVMRIARQWLRDIGEARTSMRIDCDELVVTQDPRHRAPHADFIG